MSGLLNLDLLSVGIAVAGIGVLGFSVFFNNRKSITNKSFLYFSVLTIIWSIENYLAYQITIPNTSLWLFRLVISIAVWHSFFFFQMAYVFPKEKADFKWWYKFILVPIVFVTSILNLTPFVFSKIAAVSTNGEIAKIQNGPAIILFGLTVAFLVIGAIIQFSRKTLNAVKEEKRQFQFVLIGTFITFLLLMIFNFILPAFFDNPRFIALGGVFIFPYVVFTSYAIIRHHLLNIKIITTEILAFVLAIVSFYEVIISQGLLLIILRSGIFFLVFSFGILLIRSVRKEVEQRERLEILTKQLESANTKLIELDKLKSEFLSFASHQVKSPMAVVKGYAELIADGTYGTVTDEVKDKAQKIKESADRMIALVNNLLDERKIEEGKMDFKFEQVDIAKIVGSMVEEFKGIATKKGLDMQFESTIPSLIIKADEQKIRQVIQNLIDNSIKYTEKGFVKVKLEDKGDSVLISVSDSGRGISPELQKKLFQQFVRDETTKREIQGTGLGLYIAKQIVEAHHGNIWTESVGEGKGSQFYVRLSKG